MSQTNDGDDFGDEEETTSTRENEVTDASPIDHVDESQEPSSSLASPDAIAAAVLAYIRRPGYQPVKPGVIARKLGFEGEDRVQMKRCVKKLVKQGLLAYAAKHHLRLPDKPSASGTVPSTSAPMPENISASSRGESTKRSGSQPGGGTVQGIFRRAAGGFGFVRPSARDPKLKEDVYIPLHKTRDAADGDRVAVRLQGKRLRGEQLRLAGEIIEILERETHRFVGVYVEQEGLGFVEVDGGVFAQPIFVGDPSAHGVQPDDKVVIEMVRFPSHVHDGEAVVVEVLGRRGDPQVDTLSIIREFDLPEAFPEAVLAAARESADRFQEEIVAPRIDFTNLTVVTIDPRDARDFDDAISLDQFENGHWRLGVHIADVSHFVPAKGPLDDEARLRGTSVYLPDRVLPMLPETISNHLASLQPGRVRYTLTVFIEFTADGAPVATEMHAGAIRSARRFTYEEVDSFLARREAWRTKLTPQVHQLLSAMYELAMILRQRRLTRGAIELNLPEIKVDLDRQGQVQGAHLVEHTESHQIIEEFMLAANQAVAEHLHRQSLNLLRRIHESPDPRKLRELSRFVRELGIECESLESRFEIQRVLAAVIGRTTEHAVHFAVLRSMKKARYGPEEEGHYALHSDHYCHFTSPIRRYPDLVIHRMIRSLLEGRRPADNFEQLAILGEHCSEREQRAESAERELTKVKLLNYLSSRLGERLDAVVTGVTRYGVFAQGIDLPAEGLIHVESLVDDYYEFDARAHSLVGRRGNVYRLGDLLRVEIVHVDVDRRVLDFRLVQRLQRGEPAAGEATTARETRRPRGRHDSESGPRREPGRRSRHGSSRDEGSGSSERRRAADSHKDSKKKKKKRR